MRRDAAELSRFASDPACAYAAVRSATEALVEPLSAEDSAAQSMEDASPAKWHLAHTTWFFETFVLEALPGHRAFDDSYRVLFNSYYNTVGEQHPRPRRGLLTRPSLADVRAYRTHVDERILRHLEAGASRQQLAVIELGLHHEQQHQELLLTDLKHLFSCNPLRPAYAPARRPAAGPAPSSGSPTAGRRCSARSGARRSTGRGATARATGRPSRWPGSRRCARRIRSPT